MLLFLMGEDHPFRVKDKDDDASPIKGFRPRIEAARARIATMPATSAPKCCMR
jgi:hypothetical protein